MIDEAFHHLTGLGPVRLERLRAAGIRTWQDLLQAPELLPAARRDQWIADIADCLAALEQRDTRFFVERFDPIDRWRVLGHFLNETTFVDIETEGLDYDARITVICCWHRGQLRTFVEHENLDEFLELLDDVRLLASFNGSSFDVPRILDSFHIQALPCPHLDLRWICHRRGWKGGLKEIARTQAIARPVDLAACDGAWAVQLWHDWIHARDASAREELLRYCASDVLLLVLLAPALCDLPRPEPSVVWQHLPAERRTVAPIPVAPIPVTNSVTGLSAASIRIPVWRHRHR